MERKRNINPHLKIVKDSEPPDLPKDIPVENVKDLYAHLLDTFNLISEHLENEKNKTDIPKKDDGE